MRFLILILIIAVSLKQSISQTNWIQQYCGTNSELYSISFLDELHGYVSGQHAEIFSTSNGGSNWQLLYSSPFPSDRIQCIAVKSKNQIIAGSIGSVVYRTSNAGIDWTYQSIYPPSSIHDIFFIDENTGWLVGEINAIHGYVYRKTTTGGESWFDPAGTHTFYDNNLYEVEFINSNTGFVCGANPYKALIAKTTDGGNTRARTEFPAGYYWGHLDFLNESTGWVFGQNHGTKLMQTTNCGDNWNIIYSDTTNYFMNDFHFVDENIGYYVGGAVIKTTNSGLNWFYTPIPNNPSSIESICFLNSQTGYICGYNGTIYKTTNGGLTNLTTMNEIHSDGFSLNQNYPNPFNPKTIINYELGITNYVSVKVFNALGKEVAILVNEKQTAGNYSVDFNGEGLPSGVYFYRLETGSFVETKRMVLLK